MIIRFITFIQITILYVFITGSFFTFASAEEDTTVISSSEKSVSKFETLTQSSDVVTSDDTDTLEKPELSFDSLSGITDTTYTDSIKRKMRQDSLLELETRQRLLRYPYTSSNYISKIAEGEIFRSDPTSFYNISSLRKYHVTPHTGIAHGFDRLLFMGNTSPVNKWYYGTKLLPVHRIHPYSVEQSFIANEYARIFLLKDGSTFFHPSGNSIVSPYTTVFWENGVFEETILSFKTHRPLSRSLHLSVFSQYQYFEDMKYTHDGNNVYTMYSDIVSDTTLLSHKGYNPLVKEFVCGADLFWSSSRSTLFSKFKYGDLNNEIPVNRSFTDNHPVHVRLTQYPLLLQSTWNSVLPFHSGFYTVESRIHLNRFILNRTTSDSLIASPERLTLQSRDVSGALQAGINYLKDDSASVALSFNRYSIEIPDSTKIHSYQYHPEFTFHHTLATSPVTSTLHLKCGYNIFSVSDADDVVTSPTWHAMISSDFSTYTCDVYVEQDANQYYPDFDSLENDIIHDSYLRTGMSLRFSPLDFFHTSFGFQYYPSPDLKGISRTWLNNVAPYEQPQLVYLISFATNRLSGFSLQTRLLYSDTKPYVKTHGEVSYKFIPHRMKQTIEASIGLDYWSDRNSILFADTALWNREILDLNFESAIHIKSFRLFYKVNNMLNRNFSYVPGYFSPGITFRWGFSWFIQR